MYECLLPPGSDSVREALGFVFAALGVLFLLVFARRGRRARRLLQDVLIAFGFCVGFSFLTAAMEAVPSGPRCVAEPLSQFLSDFAFWLVLLTICLTIGLVREYWIRFRASRRRARALRRDVTGQ